MTDHRPFSSSRRRLLAASSAALALSLAGAGATAPAHGAPASTKAEAANAKAKAKANAKSRAAAKRRRARQTTGEHGIVVHWSGRTHSDAPEAPNIITEEWRLYTGTENRSYVRITNTADARESIETWDTEAFGAAVIGPLDQPLGKRIARRSNVLLGCEGDHDSWGPQHEADLVTLYTEADAIRHDDTRFAALPAGPPVDGRPTRLALLDPFADNAPMQRDVGTEFLYDEATRNVVRVRRNEASDYPPVWTEPDVWEVLPAETVSVPKPPAVLRTFC